jgi:hypothetical protein
MSRVVKDTNNIPEYLSMLHDLLATEIHIGIFGEEDSDILMIANVNEFGCEITVTPKMRAYLHSQGLHLKASTTEIKIPERSFIRSGFDDREKDIHSRAIELLKKVLTMDLDTATYFDILGQHIVDNLQEYLTAIDNPENHPFTIGRKESSNPLIDTGRMRDSITFKVVKR